MYGKRCMIKAGAAAECGAAIRRSREGLVARVRHADLLHHGRTLIAVLGAVTQDHFATPHWLKRCWAGPRIEPPGLERPSSCGMKYGAAPRGDGFRALALPALNAM